MVISCSHYENKEIEDLSNDVVKDTPENLNKKEKEEIKEVIIRQKEDLTLSDDEEIIELEDENEDLELER